MRRQKEDEQAPLSEFVIESKFHERITESTRFKMKHHKSHKLVTEFKKELFRLHAKLIKKGEDNKLLQQELSQAEETCSK